MEKISVIGAGLIGRGWTIVFARAGREVLLYDNAAAALPRALDILRTNLADLASFGLLAGGPEAVLSRIRVTSDLGEALAAADYVQECVLERIEVKREVFAALDRLAPPAAILASSASFSPASAFAGELPGRERCLVAHPVNPPYLVPVVEVVPAPFTSPEAVERTVKLLKAVRQKPVTIARERYGFVLNRLQAALLNEAFRLVEEGTVSAADLDTTVKDGLGLRWAFMGPFETIDLNAPGGVVDYAERARAAMLRLAGQQSVPRPWTPELVARIEAERRESLPEADLLERQNWRDRRLMALAAHKATAEREVGE